MYNILENVPRTQIPYNMPTECIRGRGIHLKHKISYNAYGSPKNDVPNVFNKRHIYVVKKIKGRNERKRPEYVYC